MPWFIWLAPCLRFMLNSAWAQAPRSLAEELRGEFSKLDVRGNTNGDTLYALTLGMNWYLSPNLRLQTISILHYFDGPSRLLGCREKERVPLLLTELQIKF